MTKLLAVAREEEQELLQQLEVVRGIIKSLNEKPIVGSFLESTTVSAVPTSIAVEGRQKRRKMSMETRKKMRAAALKRWQK